PMAAFLPDLTIRLQEKHPYLQVQVEEDHPAGCFQKLLIQETDLAVMVVNHEAPPANDPRFEQSFLLSDPLDLLVHEGSPMASLAAVDLASLASQAWITDRAGTAYHQLFITTCLSAGFRPSIAHHASEWGTAAALVSAGLGIALIPRLAHLPGIYPLTRVRMWESLRPSRSIIVASRAGSRKDPLIADAIDTLHVLAAEAQRALTQPNLTDE